MSYFDLLQYRVSALLLAARDNREILLYYLLHHSAIDGIPEEQHKKDGTILIPSSIQIILF
ncbi:hypothetical protein D3H55_18910 [Bacillus salacetis]|uniref:Uncharacterized protein n=1 Tax=Bacillus salacetis TaxID=2315464 RepID=A0A3A1QQW2_9BACI|nr:hypothetical protein [Bacillus salacetis]RIW29511.1 hypothetical protein D3H55_18910 [Bacillus salacetis]